MGQSADAMLEGGRNEDPRVTPTPPAGTGVDSAYAWLRLAAAATIGTVGGAGMWWVPVALSAVQADFGVTRADASLAYTLAMLGFAFGGVALGRLSDRLRILPPVAGGTPALRLGFRVGGPGGQPLAVCARLRADRLRHLGDVRPDDRRPVAMVPPPARHRGRDRLG